MKASKIILIIFVLIQLIVIFALGVNIYKKNHILGVVKVNPIKKESLLQNTSDSLKFFYELQPNTTVQETNTKLYNGTYQHNADGLRERFDYSIDKPDKTFRIVTLGDSYTYGFFVDDNSPYSEQLEDLLNKQLSCKNIDKFEVINLGVAGYDIQYSVERFNIRGIKYNPDLVLWLVQGEDFINVNEIMFEKKAEFERKVWEDTPEGQTPTSQAWTDMTKYMSEQYYKYGEKNILNLQLKNLESFNKNFREPLIIFTFSTTMEKFKKIITSFLNFRPNTFFFDQISDIYQKPEYTFMPQDHHPNKKGHGVLANDLFKYLSDKGFITCN